MQALPFASVLSCGPSWIGSAGKWDFYWCTQGKQNSAWSGFNVFCAQLLNCHLEISFMAACGKTNTWPKGLALPGVLRAVKIMLWAITRLTHHSECSAGSVQAGSCEGMFAMKLWWWHLIFSKLPVIESIPWIVNRMWSVCQCTTKLAFKVKLSLLSEATLLKL